jgi:hypothetical protein
MLAESCRAKNYSAAEQFFSSEYRLNKMYAFCLYKNRSIIVKRESERPEKQCAPWHAPERERESYMYSRMSHSRTGQDIRVREAVRGAASWCHDGRRSGALHRRQVPRATSSVCVTSSKPLSVPSGEILIIN